MAAAHLDESAFRNLIPIYQGDASPFSLRRSLSEPLINVYRTTQDET